MTISNVKTKDAAQGVPAVRGRVSRHTSSRAMPKQSKSRTNSPPKLPPAQPFAIAIASGR